MSFSSIQIRKLQQNVKASDVRTRTMNGQELSYIEGWHAISEANRIFGFDGWNRKTLESRCITGRETRGTFHTLYIAKVRVTVRADEHTIIREGYGTGEGQGSSAGEAHEKAIKTAETDATKRALATFGKPFGLALYAGTQQRQPISDRRPQKIERRRTLQKRGSNGRYYVPAPPQPDPTHATTLLAQAHQTKHSSYDLNTALSNTALPQLSTWKNRPRIMKRSDRSCAVTHCVLNRRHRRPSH